MLEIQMESTHNGVYIATSLNTKWSLHYWESIISFWIVAQRGSMEAANQVLSKLLVALHKLMETALAIFRYLHMSEDNIYITH